MIKAPLTAENRSIRRIVLGDYVPRIARENPDRLAVIDGAQRLTYRDLDRASNRAAHALLATVPQGAQIGMLCANSADMIVAINGVHKAGHIWVPVNVMLDGGQIDYILRHAEVSAVIVDEPIARLPHIAAVLKALGVPVLLTRAAAGEGEALLADLMARQPDTAPDVVIDSDQVAFVMYTSGTTGHPKGVMHSHASVAAGVAANLTTFGFNREDVISCVLPLFHVGQHCVVASALAIGACIVATRGFVPGDMVDQVVKERFTVFVGLPMMYGAMLADPKGASADFSTLRLCIYAMAPMPRPLVDRIAARMSPNIMLATGQTEIYPVTMSFNPVQHPERDANYWGQSTTACETAIMDDFGTILPHGQVGEIVHRGANVMLGYFKDPDATASAQRFGWHHTGDLGVIDEGGQLLFLDRKKDMIKTGGENVASIKVETALLSHPAVASVAVVGLPHVHWSEAIAAFATRKPGMTCSDDELLAHCRERLGRFELPKAITWLDAMPMTATGKVQKHMLRKQYETLFDGQTR